MPLLQRKDPRGARLSLLQTRSHPLGARKRPGAAPSAAHVSARGKSRESAVPPPPRDRVRERERRRALRATALQTPLSSVPPLHGRCRRARLPLACGPSRWCIHLIQENGDRAARRNLPQH